ncbi:MAG TPA: MarR family transcriptional regulator [Gemmatimonadota bacterium]|nr:MarR family transcriptional regulator [Gemmatimonadota bacterium]
MTPTELESELDGPRLAAWRALLVAHARAVEAIERELAGAETLPLSWYDVLIALYEAPDRRLRMHQLASAIALSPSGLSRLVDRLEARGFLERQPCSEDRRCQFAALTEGGLATLERAWPTYAAGIARHFGGRLSDADVEALRDLLDRLADRRPVGERAG